MQHGGKGHKEEEGEDDYHDDEEGDRDIGIEDGRSRRFPGTGLLVSSKSRPTWLVLAAEDEAVVEGRAGAFLPCWSVPTSCSDSSRAPAS